MQYEAYGPPGPDGSFNMQPVATATGGSWFESTLGSLGGILGEAAKFALEKEKINSGYYSQYPNSNQQAPRVDNDGTNLTGAVQKYGTWVMGGVLLLMGGLAVRELVS